MSVILLEYSEGECDFSGCIKVFPDNEEVGVSLSENRTISGFPGLRMHAVIGVA